MCNSKEKYDYREIYITLFVSYINCWQRDNGKERELIIKEKEREGDIGRDREKERKKERWINIGMQIYNEWRAFYRLPNDLLFTHFLM